MKRIPPLLTLGLIAIWILLNDGVTLGQFLLGLILAVLLMLAVAGLRPARPRVQRLYLAVPLVITVLIDIMRSSLMVARIALSRPKREIRSGFLDIPLELTDPHALAVLAMIVTSTPGTAWAGVSSAGDTLRLHVLDLEDEGELIRTIKERYERPLKRIFE